MIIDRLRLWPARQNLKQFETCFYCGGATSTYWKGRVSPEVPGFSEIVVPLTDICVMILVLHRRKDANWPFLGVRHMMNRWRLSIHCLSSSPNLESEVYFACGRFRERKWCCPNSNSR